MKCVVELSETEEKTLQQMSLNHLHRDMRIRAAGVMMLGRKIKLTEVAAQLSVSGQFGLQLGARVAGIRHMWAVGRP